MGYGTETSQKYSVVFGNSYMVMGLAKESIGTLEKSVAALHVAVSMDVGRKGYGFLL